MKVNALLHHTKPALSRCKIEKDGKAITLTGEELAEIIETVNGKRFVIACQSNPKAYNTEFSILNNSKVQRLNSDIPFKDLDLSIYDS